MRWSRAHRLALFVIISYGVALLLDLVFWVSTRGMDRILLALAMQAWGLARMYTPTLAAAICLKMEGREVLSALKGYLKHDRRAIKYFLAAPLIMYLAGGIFLSLLYALNLLDLEKPVKLLVKSSMGLITEERARSILLLEVFLAYPTALTVNAFFALGEELGWRGYLFDLLDREVNVRNVLTVGVIWALWHSSAITLIGLDYPNLRAFGVPLFTVLCILFTLPMLQMVRRTESVLPAVSLHGSINALIGMFTITSKLSGAENEIFGGTGLLGILSWLLTVMIVYVFLRVSRAEDHGLSAPSETSGEKYF